MNLFQHAYWSEIVQLAAATIGLFVLHWSLWDAMRDSTALTLANVNGGRLLIAMNNVRAEMIKILVMAFLVLSGAAAVLLPPPVSYHYEPSDPAVANLIEQINELDSRILSETRRQRTSINIARSIEVIVALLLLFDSILARRTRAMFVRRMRMNLSVKEHVEGAVQGAKAGAEAGAIAGAEVVERRQTEEDQ